MDIAIKYFGQLAEAMGKEVSTVTVVDHCSVQELKSTLLSIYPVLEGKEFKIAVNKAIVTDKAILLPTDEVALLPPFAGG